jgi:hypothetical protein
MEKKVKAVGGDTTVAIITTFVIVLIIVITWLIVWSFNDSRFVDLIAPILVDLGLIGLSCYCFWSVTTGYTIDNDSIRIRRRKGDMVISNSNLVKVTSLQHAAVGKAYRIGAVGGLFGFFGNIYSENLGKINVHANSLKKNLLLLELKDQKEKILIAPVEEAPFLTDKF